MLQKQLPGTDLRVSAVGLGTGSYGGSGVPETEAFALLDAFQDIGGSLIDTANIYGKWCTPAINHSELTIGRYIRQRGRGRLVISTKGAHPLLSSMTTSRMSMAEIRADLEESLRALNVETIDLYWLHRDDPSRPVAELLDILETFRREGKIRYYGGSNWSKERLLEAEQEATARGIRGFIGAQNRWSLARVEQADMLDPTTRTADREMIDWLRSEPDRRTLVSFSAMAFGLFSRWEDADGPMPQGMEREYAAPINRRRLRAVQELAAQLDCPIASLVLAWQIAQPFTAIPLTFTSRVSRMEEIARASELRLTAEQIAFLNAGEDW